MFLPHIKITQPSVGALITVESGSIKCTHGRLHMVRWTLWFHKTVWTKTALPLNWRVTQRSSWRQLSWLAGLCTSHSRILKISFSRLKVFYPLELLYNTETPQESEHFQHSLSHQNKCVKREAPQIPSEICLWPFTAGREWDHEFLRTSKKRNRYRWEKTKKKHGTR